MKKTMKTIKGPTLVQKGLRPITDLSCKSISFSSLTTNSLPYRVPGSEEGGEGTEVGVENGNQIFEDHEHDIVEGDQRITGV